MMAVAAQESSSSSSSSSAACSFVCFRPQQIHHTRSEEDDSSSSFRTEPIRLYATIAMDDSLSDMASNKRRYFQHFGGGRDPTTLQPNTTKRIRQSSTSLDDKNDENTSDVQERVFLIDGIVSHIIGYLPWRQQVSACCRVSKLWNQATRHAPMRVLLLANADQNNNSSMSCQLPRVLQPSHWDRQVNGMSWNVFSKLPKTAAASQQQISHLDAYGDVLGRGFSPHLDDEGQHTSFHHQFVSHLPASHLEELQLRYPSQSLLDEMFPAPSSNTTPKQNMRIPHLQKLVIVINHHRDERHEVHASLLSRIVQHAPHLQALIIVGLPYYDYYQDENDEERKKNCSNNEESSCWRRLFKDLLPLAPSLRKLELLMTAHTGGSSGEDEETTRVLLLTHQAQQQKREWEDFRSKMPLLRSWRIIKTGAKMTDRLVICS